MPDEQPIPKKLLILDVILLIAVLVTAFAIYNFYYKEPNKDSSKAEVTQSESFKNISIQGKSAYVLDMVKNTVIFEKNSSLQLPLASITKIMTALTASDLLPKDSRITVRKEFLFEEGDTGLVDGEAWRLRDLLDFSLIVSSNDGARSIASVVGASILQTSDYDLGRKDFVNEMNKKAVVMGLSQTYFTNENGLDNGEISGGYGSAQDIGTLLRYILTTKPDLLEATRYPSTTIKSFSKSHPVSNTNSSVNRIPGLLLSKTGYTDMAGGNLAIAFDASICRPIIVVVLGSTEDGRFTDVEKLVKASLNYLQK